VATNPAPAKSAPPSAKNAAAALKSAPPARGGAHEAPAGGASGKKSSSLLKPLLVVLLLAGGAAGAWFGGLRQHAMAALESKPRTAAEKKTNAPVFLALDLLTVNLLDTDRERYLQIGIVIELNDSRVLDTVKQKMPIIRSQVLMQLANKRMADLLGMNAKEKLAMDIVARTRAQIESEAADKGVEKAHFSQFIIQ
jgi:flagellar FliL protein